MVTLDDSVLGEAAEPPLEWGAATVVDAAVRISLIQCPAAVSTRTSSILTSSDPDGNYNVSSWKTIRINNNKFRFTSKDRGNPKTNSQVKPTLWRKLQSQFYKTKILVTVLLKILTVDQLFQFWRVNRNKSWFVRIFYRRFCEKSVWYTQWTSDPCDYLQAPLFTRIPKTNPG